MKIDKLFLCLAIFSVQYAQAHSHTTYIVEQPAPSYVVVQPRPSTTVVVVESEPPAEIEEEVGPCPGVNYVWIKGHWQWDGIRWVRVHGQWVARPNAGAVWMPGYWVRDKHHWRWTEGYWR